MLTQVLKVEGEAYELAGRPEDAFVRYRRALRLLLRLADDSPPLPDPKLAAEVARRLDAYELTPATRLELCRLYEALGRYGDAEDALFEAIETDPDDPTAVDAGIAFYRRLLGLDRAELEAGNLPVEEVRAALADLLRRSVPG